MTPSYFIERQTRSGGWTAMPNTYKSKSSAQEALEYIATVYPQRKVRVVKQYRKIVDKITPQT